MFQRTSSIAVTEEGIVIYANDVKHSLKAPLYTIDATEERILIWDNEEHLLNAYSSIMLKEEGIAVLFNNLHSQSV